MSATEKYNRANQLEREQSERFKASGKTEKQFFKNPKESAKLREIMLLRQSAHRDLYGETE